jgi:hypothetical protein
VSAGISTAADKSDLDYLSHFIPPQYERQC